MTQTLKISLTSAMAAQISQPGVGGYVVYFDPTDVISGLPQAKWTTLSGSTSGGTLTTLSSIPTPFSGAKFYFVIQDTLNGAKTVVTSAITTEAQLGFSGNPTTNYTALNYRFDSFEASFQNKAADQGNLTAVNGFGIPMAVTVVQSSGGATTSMTRGYSATAPGSSMWT
ncbi:MAG: hypothetical protein ACKOEC_18985 [Acidimicrobiia bacterium]